MPAIDFQDDGSFRLLEGDTASRVPDGWREDTAQPGLFQPPWSSCRYRRLSANAFDGRITITPHCLRHLTSCTVDQCVACTEREADLAQVKTVPVTNAAGEETGTEMVRVSQQPFLSPLVVGTEENLRGKMWAVEHATQPAATARISPLTNIEATLPPHKEGRDRPMHFEPDGAIVYTKTADRDEPPKDINGYKRDPNNAWRFIPLWLPCLLRHQTGVRFAACGCIDIIMRCNNPDAQQFGDKVKYTDCKQCQKRTTLES
jgi:hypothetical protein